MFSSRVFAKSENSITPPSLPVPIVILKILDEHKRYTVSTEPAKQSRHLLSLQVQDLEADSLYSIRLRCDPAPGPADTPDNMMARLDPTHPDRTSLPASLQPRYSHMTVVQTHQGVPTEPHPPALMSCTPSSLHLCWAAPAAPTSRIPVSYRLMCQVHQGTASSTRPFQWLIVYEGPNTEVVIPGLRPAGQYNFKLQVCRSPHTPAAHLSTCQLSMWNSSGHALPPHPASPQLPPCLSTLPCLTCAPCHAPSPFPFPTSPH